MKVIYKTGNITFEQECKSRLDAWEFIDKLLQVFVPEPCGVCGSPDHHPTTATRGTDGQFTFYEHVCDAKGCGAKLQMVMFPEKDDKPLAFFPQRKDKAKKWLPNRGWVKYVAAGQSQAQDTHPADQPGDANEGGPEVPF